MGEFPWEILKAETLRLLSRELGIKRNLKREEVIAFLRSVQKRGLGPALVEEITKDLAVSGSVQTQHNGVNSHSETSPPSSPVLRSSKQAPPSTSRRTSSRKRPGSDLENIPEPLFLNDTQTEDEEDSANGADSEDRKEPESISAVTRSRGTKRVRISEVASPARNTRSRKSSGPILRSTSISAPLPSVQPKRRLDRLAKRSTRTQSVSANRPEKPSTRKQDVQPDEGSTDMDADGESEVVDDEEGEEAEQEEQFTGPGAVAAALTKASTISTSPKRRGRPPKSATAPPRVQTHTSRPKPRPATLSRIRKNHNESDARTSKRTVKPTAKAALLSPSKTSTILSRPVRVDARRRAQVAKTLGKKNELDAVITPHGPHSRVGGGNRSGSPKVVFDGVVLEKRAPSAYTIVNGHLGGNPSVQLDEFVANGLIMAGTVDPVLERDEVSSLGGSNKENDFQFRNVSEGSEPPENEHIPVGEEDAEGEPEPETPVVTQGVQQIPEVGTSQPPQSQTQLPVQPPYVDSVYHVPLYGVPQPQLQPQPDPLSGLPLPQHPQMEPQFEPLPEPEAPPQPVPGFQIEMRQTHLPVPFSDLQQSHTPVPFSELQRADTPISFSETELQLQPTSQPDPQPIPQSSPRPEPEPQPVFLPQQFY